MTPIRVRRSKVAVAVAAVAITVSALYPLFIAWDRFEGNFAIVLRGHVVDQFGRGVDGAEIAAEYWRSDRHHLPIIMWDGTVLHEKVKVTTDRNRDFPISD